MIVSLINLKEKNILWERVVPIRTLLVSPEVVCLTPDSRNCTDQPKRYLVPRAKSHFVVVQGLHCRRNAAEDGQSLEEWNLCSVGVHLCAFNL